LDGKLSRPTRRAQRWQRTRMLGLGGTPCRRRQRQGHHHHRDDQARKPVCASQDLASLPQVAAGKLRSVRASRSAALSPQFVAWSVSSATCSRPCEGASGWHEASSRSSNRGAQGVGRVRALGADRRSMKVVPSASVATPPSSVSALEVRSCMLRSLALAQNRARNGLATSFEHSSGDTVPKPAS